MPLLPFFFLALPILELIVIIKVGSAIGALNTIALLLLSSFAGVVTMRVQGFTTLMKLQSKLQTRQSPAKELVESSLILVGGVMLFVPGFITDVVGLIFLLPPLRRLIANWMIARGSVSMFGNIPTSRFRQSSGQVFEGDFEEIQKNKENQKHINRSE